MGEIDPRSAAMAELIDPNEVVDQRATGFLFTEGPVWDSESGCLLFSDIPGDVRLRYVPGKNVTEVRRPANKGNGMTYDAEGNLIVCEHATSSVVRESRDGTVTTLALHFEGKELNSPNDVCVRKDGSIYFTDPTYGRMPWFGVERDPELGFQGVYRIPPGGGALELLVDPGEYDQPNGLCFSPDESVLYINDTPRALIDAYDVRPDGSLAHRRRFAEGIGSGVPDEGLPDGMKCDEDGNVWVTGAPGVWVLSPEGELIGTVEVPEVVGNLTWGDRDRHTLYLASSTSLYAIRTKVGPHREPYMN